MSNANREFKNKRYTPRLRNLRTHYNIAHRQPRLALLYSILSFVHSGRWTRVRNMILAAKSLDRSPMVEMKVVEKASSEKRKRMQVLPTPLSPMSSSLNSRSYVFFAIVSLFSVFSREPNMLLLTLVSIYCSSGTDVYTVQALKKERRRWRRARHTRHTARRRGWGTVNRCYIVI